VRLEERGGVLPQPTKVQKFAQALERALLLLEAHGRSLLRHVAHDVGAEVGWFHGLLDPPLEGRPFGRQGAEATTTPTTASAVASPATAAAAAASSPATPAPSPAPSLRHSLVRACRYVATVPGVGGSTIQCDEHTDVGFITLDAHASRAGLEVKRRADRQWVMVEEEDTPSCELIAVMVGDTLERTTGGYYSATPHRVRAPADGERIGLPFLLRGRSDAVIDTRGPRADALAAGRPMHLAQMETTMIKELPAMDAAQSILQSWFRSSKAPQTASA
jgi:hypothetical protein